jgi:dephospho-CoA kinase
MGKITIIGLTGSIGMGKSETARMFRTLGVPVFDADAVVHRLMGKGGAAVARVEAAFPGVVKAGAVDRTVLGARVLGDDAALKKLEAIIHPLVHVAEKHFLQQARIGRKRLVVLDIPLLFEKGDRGRCDVSVVVSAPYFVQRKRVLARPKMTAEKFKSILDRQLPNKIKRRRADFVVESGLGKRFARQQVRHIIDVLRGGKRGKP